jgi:hypothetical protein
MTAMESLMIRQTLRSIGISLGWRIICLSGRDAQAPRIVLFLFHSVGNTAIKSVPLHVFAEQLGILKRIFPKFMTVGELAEAKTVDHWTACLTFDDGFLDNYTVAFPALLEQRLPATFFLCSGFLEGRVDISKKSINYRNLQPMSWSHASEMADAGMEMGCHTRSHALLSALSKEDQLREMTGGKHEIEDRLGRAVTSFAIPFGSWDAYNHDTLDVAAMHFRACCTTRASTNTSPPRSHQGMTIFDRFEPSKTDFEPELVEMASGRRDVAAYVNRLIRLPKNIRQFHVQ